MHTVTSKVSECGGYIEHSFSYPNDYEEKMEKLDRLTLKIENEAKKEYFSNSSFSILSHNKGCFVMNKMTGYLCNTQPLSWEGAKSQRQYELSRRGMRY
jgi:hypothetical protein